ncbi:RidA family protein [Klebsiella sp. RHBSTW-00484]|uniref:RidA family protein n=1 Tax=unclassified Klebsiella TaxID=2608929 RepID=UPI0015E51DFA|nr:MULTISPECIES: RidA family protein [unclassified Klebsiella]HCB1503092.1 RidA family protein [Klebsiella michiganensis]HCB1849558.1 RidA family protein [Klebsiella oxytoca]MBA7847456.1 RidA family protein [Klebsiella sp. RHBSTW-00465]MBA7934254.1 RidA family protein [Klebsiella sp. RHBSTW-00215]QLO36660.1 RidA family protein [Klebsiella sp. RHBSTW-00484]
MTKIITTEQAPEAIGPYIQGARTGNFIFTSGQLPINPQTGNIPECAEGQTRQSLENVQAIIEAGGLTVGDICKVTIFVKDLNEFAAINNAYAEFFTQRNASFPARSCVEVARLPKDVKVEIEAVASQS